MRLDPPVTAVSFDEHAVGARGDHEPAQRTAGRGARQHLDHRPRPLLLADDEVPHARRAGVAAPVPRGLSVARSNASPSRALVMKPELVLADEPTGNLDRATSDDVMRLLRELSRAEGIAFLISTHDESIAHRCDRTVTMQDGLLVG